VSTDLPLTPEDVADIVAILDGSAYQRLDVKTARFRLRVARDGDGWTQEWDFAEEAAAAVTITATDNVDDDDPRAIRAPLPGTFYRAPAPGAAPFVEAGDSVTPETVIGIIETMKLMNPVYAGASGTITAMLAENGTMVGKGAALMRLA
jgi:acetyl-CoA carboxylase biotin carboxyl carrier protein